MNAPPELSNHTLTILLVEDSIPFAQLILARLQSELHNSCEVRHVTQVQTAVDALKQTSFDLVILDLHLPDSDGLDTFQSVYRVAPAVPIVILSSNDSEDLAMTIVKTGAQDYLIKGQQDTYKLTRSLKFAIERKKRIHAEGELSAARSIQEKLIPFRNPLLRGFEVSGDMVPAVETSGDYFDFLIPMPSVGKGSLGIAVGDVTGHGLGAAMVMAETHGCLRSLSTIESDLGKILSITNDVLIHSHECSHIVTLFLGYFSESSRKLIYASAGHPAWHMDDEGRVSRLEATGVPLGVDQGRTWEQACSEELNEGDLLMVFTDGLTELKHQGRQFGNEKLFDLIRQHRDLSAMKIVSEVQNQLNKIDREAPARDDRTLVIVKLVA